MDLRRFHSTVTIFLVTAIYQSSMTIELGAKPIQSVISDLSQRTSWKFFEELTWNCASLSFLFRKDIRGVSLCDCGKTISRMNFSSLGRWRWAHLIICYTRFKNNFAYFSDWVRLSVFRWIIIDYICVIHLIFYYRLLTIPDFRVWDFAIWWISGIENSNLWFSQFCIKNRSISSFLLRIFRRFLFAKREFIFLDVKRTCQETKHSSLRLGPVGPTNLMRRKPRLNQAKEKDELQEI